MNGTRSKLYAKVEHDGCEVEAHVERFGVHEWNPERFAMLTHIRQVSLTKTLEHDYAFYFVSDVDNFARSDTLKKLVGLKMPSVVPFRRTVSFTTFYSNYHAEVDINEYYKFCDQYQWILYRWARSVIKLPLVHCTYLVRADVIFNLYYDDKFARNEYVIFFESARHAGIPQYLDNRQVYGYIAFGQGASNYISGRIEIVRGRLFPDCSVQFLFFYDGAVQKALRLRGI